MCNKVSLTPSCNCQISKSKTGHFFQEQLSKEVLDLTKANLTVSRTRREEETKDIEECTKRSHWPLSAIVRSENAKTSEHLPKRSRCKRSLKAHENKKDNDD